MSSNRRQAQAEATRQHIIDSAWRLMGQHGCAALTTNALLKEADISRGSLYHHFLGIDNVVETVLAEKLAESFSEVDLGTYQSLDEWLDAFEHYHFETLLGDTGLSRALYSFIPMGMFDARFQPLLTVMLREGFATMGRAVGAFYADQLDENDMLAIGRLLDAYSTGLGIQWYCFEDPAQARADWQCFRAMFCNHLERLLEQRGVSDA